ncbi:MAG: ABC transporter ATP-binding protein [Deltaproteobacteria bacterium]|nr:MAG: ABC transporter ATP-binding protein [Deltaproteobacteria bacterium]TMQ15959.1 MAG: ABC transporter ATP-binding protein [Deltaproteobacteria bacterium]
MLIRLLRQFLRPYVRPLAAVVALQSAATGALVYLPNLYAHIIDRGVAVGDTGYILVTGAIMLALSLVQVACATAATYFGARTAMACGRDLRGAIVGRVGEFSAREVGQLGAPSLITRTTNDVQQVQTLVLMGCTMLVAAPIMCVGGLVMALREDLSLSRLLLVSVPALAGSIGVIIWRMVPQFREMQPRIDTVNRVLREQIAGVRVVRAFVREPAEAARFDDANARLTATALRVGRLQAVMFPVVLMVFNASLVAVLWLGAQRVADRALEVGSVMAFLSYLMQILVAVMMVTFISTMIPRAAVCAVRIAEVLDTRSSVAPPAVPVVPSGVAGTVELRGVEYRYPGAELAVLKDVSLVAEPGTVTAIVGSTGAGKTTLLELIPRLIDPTAGNVVIEGTDARDIELELLWSKVGLVPQRPYLFTGTVASNLRLGNPTATEAELWAALEVAQARDFVEAMPQKLSTPIAQGGTNVSGGQRQRLSIARALLRKPAIYLFDDSFSAVDLATEARLRAALRPHVAHATVIMVAQRVASIVDADQIIVLDGGTIVGRGRHAELVATCPTYAEIVESQRTAEAA